jgi:hypothetical protein
MLVFMEIEMTSNPTRRRFIAITPVFGAAFMAACSPKAPTPDTSTPAAVTPAPSPAPATNPLPAANPPSSPAASAAALLPMLDEKDPRALALGYVSNSEKADATKFKSHIPGSQCRGCALFAGKEGDASGPCPLFSGSAVAAGGWCSSWIKKA